MPTELITNITNESAKSFNPEHQLFVGAGEEDEEEVSDDEHNSSSLVQAKKIRKKLSLWRQTKRPGESQETRGHKTWEGMLNLEPLSVRPKPNNEL